MKEKTKNSIKISKRNDSTIYRDEMECQEHE